ncbi:MAG: NADPH-dependent 7-cyano-7-deazaguanine reductase QueF [Pseudomonadales bacterium]|jgi:7-cyano-7-deazaguanine reductase|nr:NADPH-dependent 7-cyano-7-deazaguanine reductase QueF [Pseudomonadales bacterium]
MKGSIPLGQPSAYPTKYDATLLAPLPRAPNRQKLGLSGALPFCGADIWNAYEISWLNPAGLPQVARGRFIVACDSPNLIESKSLKLYLNSLNQEVFASRDALRERIARDLSAAAGTEVTVFLQPFSGMQELLEAPDGLCLDTLDVECQVYQPDPSLLRLADASATFTALVDEVLYTDLFRSRCPITGQPDWATVTLCYQGAQIDHESLLRYLVSYRLHDDFHEHCVERIFCDILERCQPQSLSVEANFLRRGGLDINPVRSSSEMTNYSALPRYNRQ